MLTTTRLVVSRKTGESITIANAVTVTITRIQEGRVRIAIEAPRDIQIARTELLDDQAE